MSPRTMLDLTSALSMLRTGRANEARELLERVIRENGGCVGTGPVIVFKEPPPRPLWMRAGR